MPFEGYCSKCTDAVAWDDAGTGITFCSPGKVFIIGKIIDGTTEFKPFVGVGGGDIHHIIGRNGTDDCR